MLTGDINLEEEIENVLGKDYLGSGFGTQSQLSRNDLAAEYQQMINLLMNEQHAPELLEYKEYLVKSLREKVGLQVDTVVEMQIETPEDSFLSFLYQQELERIKYVLRTYLRCRLKKIEQYSLSCLTNAYDRFKMSADELAYCERFQELVSKCHQDSFLSMLPDSLQSVVDDEMIPMPNLDDAVFCRVNENVGRVQAGENEYVEMNTGNMFLFRYKPLRQLLHDNKVSLI